MAGQGVEFPYIKYPQTALTLAQEYTLLEDEVEAADNEIAKIREQIGNLDSELYRSQQAKLSTGTGDMSKEKDLN